MNQREIVSALKYVSRIKHSFMLSELKDKVKGAVSTPEIYTVIEPQLYDLGLRAMPDGADYLIERLPAPVKLSLSPEERERMDAFFRVPRVSRRLERLIRQYVEMKTEKPIDDPKSLDRIREAIRVQKEQYWGKKGKARKIDYHSSYSVIGYLGYQFPVYFVQFEHILYSLLRDGLLKDRMKILDVGTGPGVVPLALIDFYNRLDHAVADVYALEKFPENIEAYNALVPGYAEHKGRVRVEKPIKADLMARDLNAPHKLDLIVFSNVLNEIDAPFNDRASAIVKLAAGLAPDGSIVIIEPADKENSMKMRKLVMRLTELGLNIYSPCSFIWCDKCSAIDCWSFEEKDDIQPTDFMKKLATTDEPYRYINTDIKFSYAILRKDKLTRQTYRVPAKSRFSKLVWLKSRVETRVNVVASVMSGELGDRKDHVFKVCDGTPSGPTYAMLAHHNVKPENEALLKAEYGDILEFDNVLVRYNQQNDSINLLVSKGTCVTPVEKR